MDPRVSNGITGPPGAIETFGPGETVTAVEAANLLVALAINDTHQPIEKLGAALERIQGVLTASHVISRVDSSAINGERPQLARDVAICLEGLQFHDRLMQQLAFVRDLLAAVLNHEPRDVAAYGAPRWAALMAAIRRRAPFDPRFELFDQLSTQEAHAAEGTCELFE